jgi:ATP-dependent Clp protease ATP-binding subunit ClpA
MPQAVIINGRNYTWSRLVSVVEVENRFVKKKIRKPVFFLRLKQKHRELTMPVQKHESAHPQFVQVDDYEPTIDISDLLDSSCRATLESAFSLAESLNHRHVEPLHIFLSSLQDDSVQAFFSRLDLDFEGLKEPLGRRLNQRQIGKFKYASEETINLVLHAFVNAYLQQRNVVNVFELFFEAYNREDFVRELLHDKGVTADKFGNMIEWVRIHERMRERYRRFHTATILKPTGPMNRAMNSVATPTLDSISEDLTTYGAQGKLPMFIGRDAEIAEIFRVMEGARQSVVLVGPGGVGKRAILSGLAQLMVEERVPELLKDKRLVRLSITHLLAGATQSQAQERLLRALQESDRSGNIVLALTDIEQLVGASSNLNGSGDLVATLVDVLKRTGMLAIATTTHQSFFRSVESSVLSRAFEKVDVAEPDIRDAIHVLESKIGGIEHDSSVSFSYSAVEASVTLTDRYMHERYLPEKAIEIARETADYVSKIKGKGTFVTDQDVARIVSQKTDTPLMQVEEKEKDKLLALEQRMHERLIGQDQAVSAVVSALRRVSAQPRSDDRPIATLLFLGPTGVGKTELAKTIAETYFNTETSIIRLDMSEYQNRSGLARMLGIKAGRKSYRGDSSKAIFDSFAR